MCHFLVVYQSYEECKKYGVKENVTLVVKDITWLEEMKINDYHVLMSQMMW